ncbi:hypothetical protein ACFL27_19665 [candidate division CSSED10-310 bacterium]|uniref:Uncharacterized protein n=1 Tax=candidate division CSSED10-310 bacterium TaxID=2855610 RepID=A0ABV6Z1T1_UNCC1
MIDQADFEQLKTEFEQLKIEVRRNVFNRLEELKKCENRTAKIMKHLEKIIFQTLDLYVTNLMKTNNYDQDLHRKLQTLTFRLQLHALDPRKRNQAALGLAYSDAPEDIALLNSIGSDPDEDPDFRLAARTALKILSLRLKQKKPGAHSDSDMQSTDELPPLTPDLDR